MMYKFASIVLVIVCCQFFSGCATIFGQKEYAVTIQSVPKEINVSVRDLTGKSFFEGKTPATVTLSPNGGFFQNKSYVVSYTKEGFGQANAYLQPEVTGLYIVGNGMLSTYGLIGWLIVDPISGGMWRLPTSVEVSLGQERKDTLIYPSPTGMWGRMGIGIQPVFINDAPISLGSNLYSALFFEIAPHWSLGIGGDILLYPTQSSLGFGTSQFNAALTLQGTVSYRFFENTVPSPYISLSAGPTINSFSGIGLGISGIVGYQFEINRIRWTLETGYAGQYSLQNIKLDQHFIPVRFGAQFYF